MKQINYSGSSKLISRIVHLLNRKAPLPLDGDGDPDWGTNGQVLSTDGNGNTAWVNQGGGGDVTDVEVNGTSVVDAQGVANVTVPTATSDLNNDSGFIDGTDLSTALADYTPTANLAAVATSGDYDDLRNKPTIPAAQIQSDWTQSDNTQADYIKNKPTIPTVNDGTLTIQQNGTTVGTFSANQSGNTTVNLTGGGGGGSYTEGDGINISAQNAISVDTAFTEASARANITSGDTFATILGKIKKFFSDLKTVAFTGSYTDLDNKPTIPAAQVNSNWDATSGVAQILNKPTLGGAASQAVANNVTTTAAGSVLDARQGKTLNDARKAFIVGKKVTVNASVTAGNDYPISCSIPSGYIPLSVTCSEYMHNQGIMGSPDYVTSGTTKCRWKNLTSGTVTLSSQVCVFYFVKNEITVS